MQTVPVVLPLCVDRLEARRRSKQFERDPRALRAWRRLAMPAITLPYYIFIAPPDRHPRVGGDPFLCWCSGVFSFARLCRLAGAFAR